jgi:hypothetical protein
VNDVRYAVAPSGSVTSVNEGATVTWTVTTTNVANETILFYSIDQGVGRPTAEDFEDNLVAASFTIIDNTASISKTIKNDTTTEGPETITLRIRTVSTSGTIVATSADVIINDTSLSSPTPTPTPTTTPTITPTPSRAQCIELGTYVYKQNPPPTNPELCGSEFEYTDGVATFYSQTIGGVKTYHINSSSCNAPFTSGCFNDGGTYTCTDGVGQEGPTGVCIS